MKIRSVLAVKILIDLAMLVLFVLLMGYHLFGEAEHEWLGISVFALFLIHNGLNWRWYKNLFKGKYTAARIYKLIINIALWGLMICNVASAVIISAEVFAPLGITANLMTGRQIHLLATVWTFLLTAVHLGLHFQMFIGLAKKIKVPEKAEIAIKWSLRVLLSGLAVYGIVVFVQRAMWEEMFLTTQFKFLQYGENIAKFLFDYTCIISLFAAVGYYSNKLILLIIKQRNQKSEIKNEN